MPFFLSVLGVLLAIAAISVLLPRTVVEGLPRDPSARAARDVLYGRVIPPCGGLRFRSAFLGESTPAAPAHPSDALLLHEGEQLLERAHEAHPLEPRVVAALGHLALARRHLEEAALLYRRAIDLRSHCSEARLGLGITLALESEATADALRRRALALESLSQFTALSGESELAPEAFYDRAVLLARVGRRSEAEHQADRYFARDSSRAWAQKLREELAQAQ